MKGLWIPYIWLWIVKILITLKIQSYFLINARMNWIIRLPRQKNYIRGNNKLFMTKTWSKSIVKRKRFRNWFLKNLIDQNRLAFTKQRKFCTFLLRKGKKQYFAKLNGKNITDNRKAWQTVKPFLSDKNKSREKKNLGKK